MDYGALEGDLILMEARAFEALCRAKPYDAWKYQLFIADLQRFRQQLFGLRWFDQHLTH
jgi:hypothetical protein